MLLGVDENQSSFGEPSSGTVRLSIYFHGTDRVVEPLLPEIPGWSKVTGLTG